MFLCIRGLSLALLYVATSLKTEMFNGLGLHFVAICLHPMLPVLASLPELLSSWSSAISVIQLFIGCVIALLFAAHHTYIHC